MLSSSCRRKTDNFATELIIVLSSPYSEHFFSTGMQALPQRLPFLHTGGAFFLGAFGALGVFFFGAASADVTTEEPKSKEGTELIATAIPIRIEIMFFFITPPNVVLLLY
jgi:hypothetical protein